MRPTITFYRVRCDGDTYQYFLAEDPEWNAVFDGRPLEDMWHPPNVIVFQPRLREGDFWGWLGAEGESFVVRPEALEDEVLEGFLERAGELLPLPYQGREFRLLNITECFDALDKQRTRYRADVELNDFELAGLDDVTKRLLQEDVPAPVVEDPVFRLDRLGSQLFKVPETAMKDIYYWEHSLDAPEEQFRSHYNRLHLTGLVFEPLYSVPNAGCPR